MEFTLGFGQILLATCRDIMPIILLILGFQLLVLRQPIPHLRRLIAGGVYVIIGLALFHDQSQLLFPELVVELRWEKLVVQGIRRGVRDIGTPFSSVVLHHVHWAREPPRQSVHRKVNVLLQVLSIGFVDHCGTAKRAVIPL